MNNPFQNYPLLIQNPVMIQQPQISYTNYPMWSQIPPQYQYYPNFIGNAQPSQFTSPHSNYIEQPQYTLVNNTNQQIVYANCNNANMLNNNNNIDIVGNNTVNNNINQQLLLYGVCNNHQSEINNNNSNDIGNNENKLKINNHSVNGNVSLINKINNFNDKNSTLIINSNNNINKNEIPSQEHVHSQEIQINTQLQQNQHLIHTINTDTNTISSNNNAKIKYYRCTFKDCDKVFPKECNLKDHIRTHTGEKPYKCSFLGCEKSFSQHGNLKKHEKVHVGDKKYFCDYPGCGKKFSASYNLKIHYRCHTNEKPYKCSFANCERSFYDKGNLKYHEKTQHMAESLEFPYSCEHMGCNAKFRTQKEKLTHHNEMEPDCLIERQELMKLIQRYKLLLKHIVKENNIEPSQDEIIVNLKNIYEETQGKIIDIELFKKYLGDSFESDCMNVEDIVDTTDQYSSKNE